MRILVACSGSFIHLGSMFGTSPQVHSLQVTARSLHLNCYGSIILLIIMIPPIPRSTHSGPSASPLNSSLSPLIFSRSNYPHPLTPSLDLRSGNSASSLCSFSLNYMLLLYKDDVMHMQHLNRAPYHTPHAYYPPHAYSSTTTEGSLSKDSIQDACRFWSPRHPMHISIAPPPPPVQFSHPHLKVAARHTPLRARGPTTHHSRRVPQYMKHCGTHDHTIVHLHPPFIYHPPHAPYKL